MNPSREKVSPQTPAVLLRVLQGAESPHAATHRGSPLGTLALQRSRMGPAKILLYREAPNCSDKGQERRFQPWLLKRYGTHRHSQHCSSTGSPAQGQLCSSLPARWRGSFFRITYLLTGVASCHPHNQLLTYFKGKLQVRHPVQPPAGA